MSGDFRRHLRKIHRISSGFRRRYRGIQCRFWGSRKFSGSSKGVTGNIRGVSGFQGMSGGFRRHLRIRVFSACFGRHYRGVSEGFVESHVRYRRLEGTSGGFRGYCRGLQGSSRVFTRISDSPSVLKQVRGSFRKFPEAF